MRRERLRSAATVVGVAMGIAVVVAIHLANESSVSGFEAALNAVSGRTTLEVLSPGVGVSEERLAELDWLREYGRVSPVIDGDAVIRPADGDPSTAELVRVLGVDILRDRPFRDYRLLDERSERVVTTQEFLALLTDPQAIVMTRAYADRHGLEVGSRVEMVLGGQVIPLIVRGLLGNEGPARVPDGDFALMDIAAAQLALGRLGILDRIDIQLYDDQNTADSEAAIGERLPPGLFVQRPERRGEQVDTMLRAFHFNLTALSYIALLVGLFLVYNTITVSVITRRAEIGMLRTVGAPRSMMIRLFVGEAVILALVGCAVGAPLGWLMAQGAVGLTASTVSLFWVATAATVPSLGLTDWLLAFGVGVPLAVVAALVPALEAARVTPMTAVRSEPDVSVGNPLPPRYLGGAFALFVVAGVCAVQPAVSGLPVFGLLAALALVFGAALLVPVVLSGLWRLRSPVDRWLGVEGMLARANLGSAIRRLSISVAALVISFAMMVAIAIMIGSFRETVVYWVGQTLQADLFVTAGRQSPVGERDGVSADVERAIVSHPAVVATDGFRSVDVPYDDSLIIVGSGRFDVLLEYDTLLFKTPADGQGAVASAIGEAAVVVSESFALKYAVQTGDMVELPTPGGPQTFRVAAVFFDYSNDRGLVVMDEPLFDTHYDDRNPTGLRVYLREDADPAQVRDELLASVGASTPVFIATNTLLRRLTLEVFDSTFAITDALEAIAILVSMFGVAATLLTLALERRREIVMLRLVGAERRHLRRMIMIEAGWLGLVSLGVGLVVGLVLSLILIFVINVQSFGWTIQFRVPWVFLLQSSLLILAATVLAGLYPARLAVRYDMSHLSGEG